MTSLDPQRVADAERLIVEVCELKRNPDLSTTDEWTTAWNALVRLAKELAAVTEYLIPDDPSLSPDLAKAAEKMFAKMDKGDKETFNEFIFMARGYGPKALTEARESIQLLVRLVDIEPGSETDLCGIHDCTCSLTHPFQLPATIAALAEKRIA